ncbi:multifunctional CCA addition/repair protein [Exilibacterium tricleocarpae]|uniref:CCA-adding enzyme n=1 Tax=Exilibacterium tricleocarpae TaxID=2591008 RepID=A0A545T3M3_9GAMM|nr:multifunctional CCA addition/repair protein [Exilibacterium tricleocarpae]TQV71798.1 multifunctional CCA addition/repair protein [Exilibacterium tricleocarpae]
MDVYLVGGAVRDQLLGYPVSERDWVVVGATPRQMLDLGYKPVGKDFPVFLHPDTREEYALARTERKTAPGYTGFQFYTAADVTLEDDLIRRDLTINAMAQDQYGHLIDPYNGRADIAAKYLRHVSPAFAEDPVRILRVARFTARYHHLGFRPAPETLALMQRMVAQGEADHLVAERVWKELDRALGERNPEAFIRVLQQCGALGAVMPELERLFAAAPGAGEAPGEQALRTLQQACAMGGAGAVRFAALVYLLADHHPRQLDAITSLCRRLGVPKEPRELALSVAARRRDCHRALALDGAALLQLVTALDGLRRPQRYEQFLLCCEAEARSFPDRQQAPYPQADLLRDALKTCLAVDAKALAQAGLQGQQLGAELRRRRSRALEQLIAAR